MAANAHTHECHLLGMKTAKQHETSTDSHPYVDFIQHMHTCTSKPKNKLHHSQHHDDTRPLLQAHPRAWGSCCRAHGTHALPHWLPPCSTVCQPGFSNCRNPHVAVQTPSRGSRWQQAPKRRPSTPATSQENHPQCHCADDCGHCKMHTKYASHVAAPSCTCRSCIFNSSSRVWRWHTHTCTITQSNPWLNTTIDGCRVSCEVAAHGIHCCLTASACTSFPTCCQTAPTTHAARYDLVLLVAICLVS